MNNFQAASDEMTGYLEFLKSKFPIFHQSNVFYRDLRYGLKYYLQSKGKKMADAELENALKALINQMVAASVLKPVSDGVWTLNYPTYRTKASGKPVL